MKKLFKFKPYKYDDSFNVIEGETVEVVCDIEDLDRLEAIDVELTEKFKEMGYTKHSLEYALDGGGSMCTSVRVMRAEKKEADRRAALSPVERFLEDHKFELGRNVIKLDNGKYLFKEISGHRFQPRLTFISSPENLTSFEFSELKDARDVLWDGKPYVMYGNFWVSKKGTPCFEVLPQSKAKHMLVQNCWGGAFATSRGKVNFDIDTIPVYKRLCQSSGGGLGNDYYVLPVNFRNIVSEDDI